MNIEPPTGYEGIDAHPTYHMVTPETLSRDTGSCSHGRPVSDLNRTLNALGIRFKFQE